jgi:hypothetical protein
MSRFQTQDEPMRVVKFVAGVPGGLIQEPDGVETPKSITKANEVYGDTGVDEQVRRSKENEFDKLAKGLSPEMKTLLQKIHELGDVVNAYVERQAAARTARFNTNGVQKSDAAQNELAKAPDSPIRATSHPTSVESGDVAQQELNKALANPKPMGFESTSSAKFRTVETGSTGRQIFCDGSAFGADAEKVHASEPTVRRPFQPR